MKIELTLNNYSSSVLKNQFGMSIVKEEKLDRYHKKFTVVPIENWHWKVIVKTFSLDIHPRLYQIIEE